MDVSEWESVVEFNQHHNQFMHKVQIPAQDFTRPEHSHHEKWVLQQFLTAEK